MTFANDINSMSRTLNQIMVQIAKTRELIDQSPRPTDAIPVEATLPFFVIHPDHLDGWKSRVDEETLKRLSLCARPNVFIAREEEIQALPYALDKKELADFRRGKPVLIMATVHQIREPLRRGGRTKDVIEVELREALAFEVYRRDIEIRAIEALQAKKDGRSVSPTKLPEISTLASMVWVDDLPMKQRKVEANQEGNGPADADEWCNALSAFYKEGRRLAVARTIGANRPKQAENAIIAETYRLDTPELTSSDLRAALKEAARHVELLMRAYKWATRRAELKYDLSQRLHEHLTKPDGRRTKPYDPVQVEIMTKLDHIILTQNTFTAKELTEIAFLADSDPNLLCTSHMLASVEFGIARQLGRRARGKKMAFDRREVDTLSWILLSQSGERSLAAYPEVHALIADYAIKLMSVEERQDLLRKR